MDKEIKEAKKSILLICKFFPVQGGVSSETILFVKDLIKSNLKVHLLTNSFESEDGFRQVFSQADYQETINFITAGHSEQDLIIHKLDTRNKTTHIPNSPIYTERLFGKGIEIIENNQIDQIFGWYYQPNGFVASMLGKCFNIPVIVNNAGSDLGRLSQNENLYHTYKWMANNATHIVARKSTQRILLNKFGTEISEKFVFPIGKRKIARFFNPNSDKINFTELIQLSLDRYKNSNFYQPFREKLITLNKKELNTELPIIGMYGKCGEVKGSWDIIGALDLLSKKNIDFQFVYIMPGFARVTNAFLKFVFSHPQELLDRIWILPPIAVINIPKFIKSTRMIFCLERDFPIAFHNVSIPFEVLSVGTCLCVSEESLKNSSLAEHLIDKENALIIKDPKDINALSTRIEEALVALNLDEIGKKGFEVSQYFNEYLKDTDPMTDLVIKKLNTVEA